MDFSREVFSPHALSACGVFHAHGGRHGKGEDDGRSVVHEGKTGIAAGGDHVAAHGDIHARKLVVQHRGQLFRRAGERERHDGVVVGVPAPEHDQRDGRGVRRGHKRGGVVFSGR